jgi:hypothetical protein
MASASDLAIGSMWTQRVEDDHAGDLVDRGD